MKVLGIIAEYNPFHLGHLYHLKKSIESIKPDFTIAVMSGNFTQRGEAAITDKWVRAEAAVRCGIDLVLELPVVYAVQTAELFAYGGIQLLNLTGLTTHVSFGSEAGALEPLQKASDILVSEGDEYKGLLKKYLSEGLSFPAARYRALIDELTKNWDRGTKWDRGTGTLSQIGEWDREKGTLSQNDGLTTNKWDKEPVPLSQNDGLTTNKWDKVPVPLSHLACSNSILGIEYLKALKRTKSSIVPVTINRVNSSYNSTEIKKGISSATSIRNEIMKSGMSDKVRDAMPQESFEVLSRAFADGLGPAGNDSLSDMIMGLLRRCNLSEIASWMDVGEGLENRIKECAVSSDSLPGFLNCLKTKRYVHTRLQRILIHGLLNLTADTFERLNQGTGPKYLRILAFSSKAAPLLKQLKETARVPVITKAAHYRQYDKPLREMFEFDCLATDLYSLGMTNPSARKGDRDFTHDIFIL